MDRLKELSFDRYSSFNTQKERKISKQDGEIDAFCEKVDDKPKILVVKEENDDSHSFEFIWIMIAVEIYFHIAALYGLYLAFISAKWQTILWMFVLDTYAVLGVIGGAHRLWSHRSFKAKLPLKIFLLIGFTMALQLNLTNWVRDHRVHHKYVDTIADPHNSKRGFFFCHMGWLLVKKRPECLKQLRKVDLSDLFNDPIVRFHRKYYWTQAFICAILIPTIIPMYFWRESLANAYFVASMLRLILVHHQIFFVNSAAHKWGSKPYDVNINPTQNMYVTIATAGEGFHNFHHTFPCDYSGSEYGMKYNLTTVFIDFMAWIGLAYDRKVVSKSVINARKLRTGENHKYVH